MVSNQPANSFAVGKNVASVSITCVDKDVWWRQLWVWTQPTQMGSRLGHVLTEKPQASTLTSQGLGLFIGKTVCLAFLLVVLRQIIYMKNVANCKLH